MDHSFLSDRWLNTFRLPLKTGPEFTSVDRRNERIISWAYVPRAERGESSDLLVAGYEDVQETESADMYVTRLKHKGSTCE